MNVFHDLFIRIAVALGTVIWVAFFMTLASAIRIKSRNQTAEFEELKKSNKGLLLHSKFLLRNDKKAFILICLIVVIGSFIASSVAFGNQKYYDMRGNAYKDPFQVVFYTESGEEYVALEDEYAFVQVNMPNNKISGWNCFLDKKGYLVFLSDEDIEYDENAPDYEPFCYYDKNNNCYADTSGAYWDKNGELFFTSQDREKMDELVSKLNDLIKEPSYE
ncbi:MAG: hypothetical protein J1E05_07855 [Eubacterium sp.]|nr:hypothetical protein [Eubacterium sp.]